MQSRQITATNTHIIYCLELALKTQYNFGIIVIIIQSIGDCLDLNSTNEIDQRPVEPLHKKTTAQP